MRYFEEYKCGCVSGWERRKRDLLGYCKYHGADRIHIYSNKGPVLPDREEK
jgi:hypothetical protein